VLTWDPKDPICSCRWMVLHDPLWWSCRVWPSHPATVEGQRRGFGSSSKQHTEQHVSAMSWRGSLIKIRFYPDTAHH